MAFLHRVVNGNGTIEREYAIGSRRIDLLVRYGAVNVAMELKVWRDGKRDPLPEGLRQLDRYLSGLGLETGWLVIFDQRSGFPEIAERVSAEPNTPPQDDRSSSFAPKTKRRIQSAKSCSQWVALLFGGGKDAFRHLMGRSWGVCLLM